MRYSFWHVQALHADRAQRLPFLAASHASRRSSCTLDILLDCYVLLSGLKKLGPKWIRRHKACRDRGFAMHLPAIYTVITRRKCALRHTSARCAQYLQDRGLLCDTPPCDLHSIYNTEVCFGTHLRAICIVITNAFEHSIYFGGALCDTPPRDLPSFYECLWALNVVPFYFGGAFFAHLRAICIVITTTYAFRRCGRLGTL